MDANVYITDIKTSFIRSQTRLLSAPIKPSPSWKETARAAAISALPTTSGVNNEDDHGEENGGAAVANHTADISDKTVDDIVAKVNAKITAHGRSVFSLQAQRHVAEQIDTLYWIEVTSVSNKEGKTADGRDAQLTWVKRMTDLSDSDAIKTLPEDFNDLHTSIELKRVDGEEVQQYEKLRTRLVNLARRRDEQRQRREQYRNLQELLAPFENARENIQPNLVTKDGELAKELERMRVLLARVTARLGNARLPPDDLHQRYSSEGNAQKLRNILEME